jgi:hypothetical protein
MKAGLVVIAALAGLAAEAEDLVLVSVDPAPARFNSSTATLTPDGVYWTFSTPKASVTLTPRGESYATFRSLNSTVTLLPAGQVVYSVRAK